MTTNPSPAIDETFHSAGTAPQIPEVLHSLQDLPVSLGQVSRGPLGAVARKDHRSWKMRSVTHPFYWSGRIDSAVGEWVKDRPLPSIAACIGIGALAGLLSGCCPRVMRR